MWNKFKLQSYVCCHSSFHISEDRDCREIIREANRKGDETGDGGFSNIHSHNWLSLINLWFIYLFFSFFLPSFSLWKASGVSHAMLMSVTMAEDGFDLLILMQPAARQWHPVLVWITMAPEAKIFEYLVLSYQDTVQERLGVWHSWRRYGMGASFQDSIDSDHHHHSLSASGLCQDSVSSCDFSLPAPALCLPACYQALHCGGHEL